jgi:hypothetical protein
MQGGLRCVPQPAPRESIGGGADPYDALVGVPSAQRRGQMRVAAASDEGEHSELLLAQEP